MSKKTKYLIGFDEEFIPSSINNKNEVIDVTLSKSEEGDIVLSNNYKGVYTLLVELEPDCTPVLLNEETGEIIDIVCI